MKERKNEKIKISLMIAVAFLLFVLRPSVAFASESNVRAFDTVAGFETVVTITGKMQGDFVTVAILRPDQSQVKLGGSVDASGQANITVPANRIKIPGQYLVRLDDGSDTTTFEVMPETLDTSVAEVGGDPLLVAQASNNQVIATSDHFEIDVLPASVTQNEPVSFRVSAVDANGSVASSYRGTIVFSSTDQNAQLPNPYTFVAADQGRHTFDLSARFRGLGTHELRVREESGDEILAKKGVEVTAAAAVRGASYITITKPSPGTYSYTVFEIAGQANSNSRVLIFDNGQQIGEVSSNTSGRFTYNTSVLRDGPHVFQAESNGVQSDPVSITIDSTPAQVDNVEIEKYTLAPGATTRIVVRSDPDLSKISATIDDYITDLQPDFINPGTYRGTLVAPQADGEYPVYVTVTDRLGNAAKQPVEVGRIRVESELSGDVQFSFNVPSKIQSVQAFPGPGSIALTWMAATADSGIALYRIYYGQAGTALNLVANTTGPETTWTITNLQNGTPYTFRVVGVDKNGNEGDNLSDPVTSSPNATATGSGPVLCDPAPCPPDIPYAPAIPEDGPGVVGALLAAIGVATLRRWYKK